jgi:hypothetical protein
MTINVIRPTGTSSLSARAIGSLPISTGVVFFTVLGSAAPQGRCDNGEPIVTGKLEDYPTLRDVSRGMDEELEEQKRIWGSTEETGQTENAATIVASIKLRMDNRTRTTVPLSEAATDAQRRFGPSA